MEPIEGTILVIGGNSRIAGALEPVLGDNAIYAVRGPGGRRREVLLRAYEDMEISSFRDVRYVVNCVGISTGDAAQLHRVNVDIPIRLAQLAKNAGVRRFIHISSFSAYGMATEVNSLTPTLPVTDYGRSKLAGDEALLAMGDDGFAVTVLRLPLIYARGSWGKLGTLLNVWRRIRVFPIPARDVARAMIGVELVAQVIALHLARGGRGVQLAADPRPFCYRAAAAARSEPLGVVPLPQGLISAARRFAPGLGQRLFADSKLLEADNLAITYNLASRLFDDIREA